MEFLADFLYELPKTFSLVFDVAHFVVCLQGEKADMGDTFENTTRNHPLASWASAMLICFAHTIFVAFACGEPILDAIDDPLNVVIASVLWYLLFYSPNDIVYKTSKAFPFRLPLYILKGLYYPKKIVSGIKHAKHIFHGNVLALVIVATLKSNGAAFMTPIARFVRGNTNGLAGCLESLKPTLATKLCFFASLLYVILPIDLVYIVITGALVAMKAGPLLGFNVDFLGPIENKIVPIVFGVKKEEEKKE